MIIRNLMLKELRHLLWVIVTGLLLSIGVALMTVITFYYMAQVVEELPVEVMELLLTYEITRELISIFGDYSLYIWSQWHAKNLYQLGSLLVIIIAAIQFAGEVNNRTIGFYLTRPINRRDGYLGKTLTGLLIMVIVFGGGTAAFWLISVIAGYTAEWSRIFIALAVSLTWLAVYYLLASLISVSNREPVMAGVMIGISGVLLSLPGMFALTRQYSIFYQMRAMDYFLGNESLLMPLSLGVALIILLMMAGLHLFAKKDF